MKRRVRMKPGKGQSAAGMAVAIPAGVALSWAEGVIDRLQSDLEDLATRIFTRNALRPAGAAG